MSLISLTYPARDLPDNRLFQKIESEGHSVGGVIFVEYGFRHTEDFAGIFPPEMLDRVGGNSALCIFAERGRGVEEGSLEDPKPGRLLLLYHRPSLTPFVAPTEPSPNIEETDLFYAETSEQLGEALIGVLRLT